MNLVERDIHYTHRASDFTQDVYVAGVWVASATNNHTGEEVADEVQYRPFVAAQGLLDDVTAACEAEGVTSTQIPSWLAEAQAHVAPAPIDTTSPAYRLQINRVIINTQAALRVPCRICQGDHLTQFCPEIRALLFDEPVVMVVDVDFAPVGFAA